ncbi:putative RNA recognition motif domain, nucleotide-binding alpha-beta plait domain superfamily [Helianthus debilis subsp. tardiflorus]
MEEDGPWMDPHHLGKKAGIDNKGKQGTKNVTKFFVTNLPQGCTPWERSEFVKVFGEVAGVYIAKKKDKVGNTFGFISFINVREVKELERALNGTKMGGSKLRVNIARFAAENANILESSKVSKGKGQVSEVGVGGVQVHQQFKNQAFIKEGGGKLFSDLFSKDHGVKVANSSKHVSMQVSDGIMVEAPEAMLAFQDLIGKAAIGRCVNLMTINSLKILLNKKGFSDICLSYLGGLCMLVKFPSVESCNGFVCNHDLWYNWFSSLDHWNGQTLPFERIAWLKVVGGSCSFSGG